MRFFFATKAEAGPTCAVDLDSFSVFTLAYFATSFSRTPLRILRQGHERFHHKLQILVKVEFSQHLFEDSFRNDGTTLPIWTDSIHNFITIYQILLAMPAEAIVAESVAAVFHLNDFVIFAFAVAAWTCEFFLLLILCVITFSSLYAEIECLGYVPFIVEKRINHDFHLPSTLDEDGPCKCQ